MANNNKEVKSYSLTVDLISFIDEYKEKHKLPNASIALERIILEVKNKSHLSLNTNVSNNIDMQEFKDEIIKIVMQELKNNKIESSDTLNDDIEEEKVIDEDIVINTNQEINDIATSALDILANMPD